MANILPPPPTNMDPKSPSFRDWFYKIQQILENYILIIINGLDGIGNGIVVKTSDSTYAARTIEGTANQITVTDGDGVAANPTLSIPTTLIAPGSVEVTTDLNVKGDAFIGDDGTDLTEFKSRTEFDLNLDSYVSIDGETARTNGLGFFFGTLNYSNSTAANYQIFTRPNVSVAKTNWRAVSIRCDSPVTSTGLISTVSGLELSGGPSWLGTAPTNWRQLNIGDVTVATNTYGIYNAIASGTNKWGYYGIGTASNYMEGALGIGIDNSVDSQLRISKAISGANTSYLGYYSGAVQSTVATSAVGMRVRMDTQAASFTLPLMTGFLASQGTIGATSTVTTQYGFHANSTLTGATNNYGFYSDIASASNRWNFFANGTANSAFNGNVRFGGITAPTVAVDVTGAVLATTSIRSSGQTSGIGYATGAGSTVTQGAGSGKATGVTLNRVCGQITMNNATLNAGASVTFTLSNTAIAATDVVIVNIASGATADSYQTQISAVATNSCNIQLRNVSAGNLSEAVVLNFAVIKAVNA
jgi:hypothetical protein